MEPEKKDESLVATAMKNGGGAVTGAVVGGGIIGPVVAGVLAPFSMGLSVLIPPALAIMGGLWGHKKSQELD